MSKTKPIVAAIPGDLHLAREEQPNHRDALKVIDEINSLIRPDFVQFIGDNVQDATEEQFRLFDDLRAKLKAPHFVLVGDHDVDRDTGIEKFQSHIGESRGSTRLEGYRFLRLNSREGRPVGFGPDQIDWLRSEFEEARRENEQVTIFQHNYPYQIWEDYAGPGVDDWRILLHTHRTQAIICGHTHYLQTANDGRNALFAVRSIGDPEGGRPGYAVAFFQGEDLAIAYRTVDETGPLLMITHPRASILANGPKQIVTGPDEIRVRVWSSRKIVGITRWIDEKDPKQLFTTDEIDWVGSFELVGLSKGEHLLEVVAGLEDGTTARATIDFFVDPTGRYTPVPRVRPWVASTAFC